MALVMAAESEEIDFRCLVANICDRLSGDEIRRIVYIWLFSKKERLKDANGLDIFSELEYADILSPAKPEGLLAVVEEIGNKKVANTIKDFIKKRRKQVSGKPAPPRARPRAETAPSTMPDTHLQTCYKVALGQMNLLLQQLEVLRQAAKAGDQEGDEAQQAVEKISSTATGLARRLKSKRARKQIGLPRSQSGSSTGSSSASDTQGDYELIANLPTPFDHDAKAKKPPPPPVKPRPAKAVLNVAQEETPHRTQDSSFVHSRKGGSCSLATKPLTAVHQPAGSPPMPTTAIRYVKTLPNSYQSHRKPQTSPVHPRREKVSQPQLPVEVYEYHTLQPNLEPDGTGDSGVGASGGTSGDGEFTDATKYMKQALTPPIVPRRDVRKGEQRSYQPLDRHTLEELMEYTPRSRQEMDRTLHAT